MSPPRYRPVIEGELEPRYATAFAEVTFRADHGETEIIRPIIDASHPQRLVEPIAGLGLTPCRLTPLETENAGADPQPQTGRGQ
jgi:hypothetical protein